MNLILRIPKSLFIYPSPDGIFPAILQLWSMKCSFLCKWSAFYVILNWWDTISSLLALIFSKPDKAGTQNVDLLCGTMMNIRLISGKICQHWRNKCWSKTYPLKALRRSDCNQIFTPTSEALCLLPWRLPLMHFGGIILQHRALMFSIWYDWYVATRHVKKYIFNTLVTINKHLTVFWPDIFPLFLAEIEGFMYILVVASHWGSVSVSFISHPIKN